MLASGDYVFFRGLFLMIWIHPVCYGTIEKPQPTFCFVERRRDGRPERVEVEWRKENVK